MTSKGSYAYEKGGSIYIEDNFGKLLDIAFSKKTLGYSLYQSAFAKDKGGVIYIKTSSYLNITIEDT